MTAARKSGKHLHTLGWFPNSHRSWRKRKKKITGKNSKNQQRKLSEIADFCPLLGHTPSTAGTLRKKFRKNSGKTPETLSERFLEFPSRVRLGCPKPCNSRHSKAPEHFQNSLPPSTAGDASFFRSGSGEGLSEPVMEFPAVLGAFLTCRGRRCPEQKNSRRPGSIG